jgi:hypothetical protein
MAPGKGPGAGTKVVCGYNFHGPRFQSTRRRELSPLDPCSRIASATLFSDFATFPIIRAARYSPSTTFAGSQFESAQFADISVPRIASATRHSPSATFDVPEPAHVARHILNARAPAFPIDLGVNVPTAAVFDCRMAVMMQRHGVGLSVRHLFVGQCRFDHRQLLGC